MENTLRLGKIWGIPIGIHPSWYLIFALLTWSLATGTFPTQIPGYAGVVYWFLAALTSLMFFASVVAHELGHSIVAIRNGIPVANISLFAFGGVAQIKDEPNSPGVEFRIAAAGPLVSLFLAGVFGLLYWMDLEVPILAAPTAYLARVNLMLVLFNMIPAFPMDGGRIFRAIAWKLSGSLVKATRWASAGGQLFGFGFITLGIYLAISGNMVNGLWLVFIGWFLRNLANSANQQMEVRHTLDGVSAGQVATAETTLVSPLTTIYQIVHQYILLGGQRRFLVVEYGQPVGVVTFRDIQRLPQNKWRFTTANQIMVPLAKLTSIEPELPIMEAAKLIQQAPTGLLAVNQGEGRINLIAADDIMNYLQMRKQLGF